GPYAYKTLHRRTVLRAERRHNQQLRRQLTAALPPAALLVTDALPATYKAASPFRNPDPHPARMLLLAGWPTADPSQAVWRYQLTGTRDFAESMRRLARRGPQVRWLLTPGAAFVLNQQLRRAGAKNRSLMQFRPEQKPVAGPANPLGYYLPYVEIVK
ncbi:MAG: hypothetical protein H7Z21_03220, partial [Hymenobacter sp.]|nr:hypothetical protein [Hymenobacter sp.]